jgi:hypothetical protein
MEQRQPLLRGVRRVRDYDWLPTAAAALALIVAITALVLAAIAFAQRGDGPANTCTLNQTATQASAYAFEVAVNDVPEHPPFTVTPITFPQPVGGIFGVQATFEPTIWAVQCQTQALTSYSFVYGLLLNVTQSNPMQTASLEVDLALDQIVGLSMSHAAGATGLVQANVYSASLQSNVLGWQWGFLDANTLAVLGPTAVFGEDALTITITYGWVQ